MSFRVVQITDLHLFAAPEGRLLGVDTDRSLRGVLAALAALRPAPDLLLATGDLVQDESAQGYARLAGLLREHIGSVPTSAHWTPGNHDDGALGGAELARGGISSEPVVERDGWRILLLTTQQPGRVEGRVDERERARLERQLEAAERADQHVLLASHHPLLPVGAAWLDGQRVAEGEELARLLERHGAVRGVLHGHVHMETTRVRAGLCYWTTPATCFQFAPDSTDFALDPLAPGFRVLDLHPDGSIDTRVQRVADAYQAPDASLRGY